MTKGGHNYAQKEHFTSKSKYADLCKNYRCLLTFKSLALTKKTMPMIIVGWDCRKKYPALLIEMGFNNTICKISRCCCGLLSGEWKRSLTIIFKFNYCLHFTTNFKANFALPASNLYKKEVPVHHLLHWKKSHYIANKRRGIGQYPIFYRTPYF